MIVEELVAALSLKVDTKALDQFNDKLGNLKDSLITFAAPVAAAAGTIFGFAKATADAGENAANMAQKFGISAQSIQELQFAARGEAEALMGSFNFLNKSLEAAASGSKEQSEAFKKLGVSAKDANGKIINSEDAIMRLSDGFKDLPNGAEKTALAMKIFGRSGSELLPFLNQGSEEIARLRKEAIATGYVLGEEAVADSEKFNDAMDDSINILKGLRNTLGARLLPIVTKVMLKFGDFVKVNRQLLAQKAERFFSILSTYIERSWKFAESLMDAVSGLTQVFGGFENVLKAVATAMVIFAGGKILFGIGQMVGAIKNLGTALTMVNLKALAIPILIGAAVVAVGLIIEDIVAFFQGKDSVTGVIVEKFKEMFSWLEEAFQGMNGWVKGFIAVLLMPFRAVVAQIKNIIDLISVVRGKMSFGDAMKNMGERQLGVFNISKASESLGAATGFADGSASKAAAPSVSEISGGGSAKTQNNEIKNDINISVGPGVSPGEVGREVEKVMSNPWDSVLRGADRSFDGAEGAY